MQTVYKLTRPDRTTYNGFLYEPDREYRFPGNGDLCSSAYCHAYRSPELAVLCNLIHAAYDPHLLFECDADVEQDDGLKLGVTRIIVPAEPINAPVYTTEQRIAWAIACAWPRASAWQAWAHKWLSGDDRSAKAAWAAAEAAWAAAEAAAWAARAAAGAYIHRCAMWAHETTGPWTPQDWWT